MHAQTVLPKLLAEQYFQVGFEQNGVPVPVENHEVVLQKDAFTLVFYFPDREGILVNASVTPESFERARAGRAFKEISGFSDLGMAEEAFNPRALLLLSTQAPHFWYYANAAEHRFNEVQEENGLLVCRRIVANVMYRDTTKQLLPLRQMPEQALYLVFMKTEWTKDYRQQIEKQRDYVKIVFR